MLCFIYLFLLISKFIKYPVMPKGKILIKKEYQLGTVYPLLNLRMTWIQDCSYFELCASFNELLFGNMEFLLCLKKKSKEAKYPLSSLTHKFILKPLCIY